MKRIFGILLAVVMTFSMFVFTAREDNSELADRIAELEAKLESQADYDDSDLKKQIEDLEKIIEDLGGYDAAELLEQVNDLESKLSAISSDFDTAKATISILESTLNSLETTLSGLENYDDEAILDELDNLRTEINLAKARILILEGKVDGDPDKVYSFGDTVSYSSNGLLLFTIKLTYSQPNPYPPHTETQVAYDLTFYNIDDIIVPNSIMQAILQDTTLNTLTPSSNFGYTGCLFSVYTPGNKIIYIGFRNGTSIQPFMKCAFTLA